MFATTGRDSLPTVYKHTNQMTVPVVFKVHI
jgi:hypothetical protein